MCIQGIHCTLQKGASWWITTIILFVSYWRFSWVGSVVLSSTILPWNLLVTLRERLLTSSWRWSPAVSMVWLLRFAIWASILQKQKISVTKKTNIGFNPHFPCWYLSKGFFFSKIMWKNMKGFCANNCIFWYFQVKYKKHICFLLTKKLHKINLAVLYYLNKHNHTIGKYFRVGIA